MDRGTHVKIAGPLSVPAQGVADAADRHIRAPLSFAIGDDSLYLYDAARHANVIVGTLPPCLFDFPYGWECNGGGVYAYSQIFGEQGQCANGHGSSVSVHIDTWSSCEFVLVIGEHYCLIDDFDGLRRPQQWVLVQCLVGEGLIAVIIGYGSAS